MYSSEQKFLSENFEDINLFNWTVNCNFLRPSQLKYQLQSRSNYKQHELRGKTGFHWHHRISFSPHSVTFPYKYIILFIRVCVCACACVHVSLATCCYCATWYELYLPFHSFGTLALCELIAFLPQKSRPEAKSALFLRPALSQKATPNISRLYL